MAKKQQGKKTGRAKAQGSTKKTRYVYFFGKGKAEGHRGMRDLLGGKGANLAEMTNAGLPVPPGFTMSTDACRLYYTTGRKVAPVVDAQMIERRGRRQPVVAHAHGVHHAGMDRQCPIQFVAEARHAVVAADRRPGPIAHQAASFATGKAEARAGKMSDQRGHTGGAGVDGQDAHASTPRVASRSRSRICWSIHAPSGSTRIS